MKKLKAILQKLVSDFRNAVIFGTFVGVVLFYCISIMFILAGDPEFTAIIGSLLTLNVICVIAVLLLNIGQRPHKYDPEIIGDNFIGLGKKNRIFSHSVENLLKFRTAKALSGFKLLEEHYSEKLTQSETAVLNFYIARCYDIMDYCPNAARYYEMAIQQGLQHKILPLFYARCIGGLGDTEEATKLYMKILGDDKSDYRQFVRTDIGRMYLRLNDGVTALKWYEEAMEKHENYAEALGGAAVAHTILHNFEKGEQLYRAAMLNEIGDPEGYTGYYKKVQAAALMETHTQEAVSAFEKEAAENNKDSSEEGKEEN